MGEAAQQLETKEYNPLPTLRKFHESGAQIRCCVGPVGSGKTSAASMDIGYYLPFFLYDQYKIKKTRWVIIRNSYVELKDTTQKTVFEWFPDGHLKVQANEYLIKYANGIQSELLFRSCDRPQDIKKFKSLELTGYWIDESIEVAEAVKRMLKNRIGRYPPKCPVRFGIETTNPPDVEHPTYSEFDWGDMPPPGPIPEGTPKANHAGFWQPPRENQDNLRPRYYDDLINDYADCPDWASMYVEGKPGVLIQGKLVYNNFRRELHVAKEPLVWSGGPLYRGWDDSGNCPACIVLQIPTAGRLQILREFTTDRMNIVDFSKHVAMQCNVDFPNAEYVDWDDPAGHSKFSKKEGGFTSNAELIREAIGIGLEASEQNLDARINAVDGQLALIDGMLIDPSCTRLINGFVGGYCYPEIGTTGEYSDHILKNRFSHIQDALQYVAVRLAKNILKRKPKSHWRQRNRRPNVV
jgi:hypothetical protein